VSKPRALLLAKMDPPAAGEREWNEYYNNKHVADRVAIPGFLSAQRFALVGGVPPEYAIPGDARYLALYDLEDIGVLKGEAYHRIWEQDRARPVGSWEDQMLKLPKFARGIYEQIGPNDPAYDAPPSRFVLVVGPEVARGKAKEFNAWYETEHIPALLEVPGVLAIRRFVMAEKEYPPITGKGGVLSRFLAIWDVADEGPFETDAFRKAATSPWSRWVHGWSTRKICAFYRRMYPAN